jgi:hypothetical protein
VSNYDTGRTQGMNHFFFLNALELEQQRTKDLKKQRGAGSQAEKGQQ